MTHRKDVVTWAGIMAMPLDQIPKGDPFARGRGPADPLRERAMADALAAPQLAERVRELEAECADVPALIARVRELEAECERDEAKAHVVCLEALLREKTEECDELDEERREAWQHVQNNMSHVFLKGAHGALADAGNVEVPPLTEPIDETIRAIVRERDEMRCRVRELEAERDEARAALAAADTGAPCDGHRHCCADRRKLAEELLRVRAERDALKEKPCA